MPEALDAATSSASTESSPSCSGVKGHSEEKTKAPSPRSRRVEATTLCSMSSCWGLSSDRESDCASSSSSLIPNKKISPVGSGRVLEPRRLGAGLESREAGPEPAPLALPMEQRECPPEDMVRRRPTNSAGKFAHKSLRSSNSPGRLACPAQPACCELAGEAAEEFPPGMCGGT